MESSVDDIIVIECCDNCKHHGWHCRHDQAKYDYFYNECTSFPSIRIVKAAI